ncbi:MAG: N-6 DNA methylase [Bacteroidales bacterium]|nr:N-6 DNA methylase [Bacteroidales bacterium]MCF8374880.1 N-6 DNA methylase [Bacteroidales bacterium]MCF8399716.1 N-6 DNA methylase [Bacteroidales bacterium]
MSLFQKSVEKKYLNDLTPALIDGKYADFRKYFGDPEIQENIRNAKEEQFQEGFLRELFGVILGYTLNPQPNFNLTTELKNVANSKKADGAILKGEHAIAVIELKGTDTTDLDKIESQAFGYKNQHPQCKYVITSNFEKLRFYIQNAVDHIDFDLFDLTREQFALLWLCLAKDHLLNDLPLKIKESSLLQEEKITKKLYADYSKFREAIYNNLVKNNPGRDKLLLFKKTQKLLDRFLFIFFAEDRLLLPPNSISEIVKQWNTLKELDEYVPLYTRFKKYFGYLNKGYKGKKYEIFPYNGGLFKPDEILDNISIDDDILHEHTLNLSKYDFETDVDVNILGHIFEHSLGEIENVQAEIAAEHAPPHALHASRASSKRKKDGIFYTPKYITKYIVENTVGKLCEEKKAKLGILDEEYTKGRKNRKKDIVRTLDKKLEDYRNWLLGLSILDPACGSGAFLNQALEFLITEHRKIDELRGQLLGGAIVFSDISTDILEKNIFGVDLNEESVEIAKLSLWLRTAQKGRKLNTLSNNIKCGNSLIDDPEVAGEKAFNWHREFPGIFRKKAKKLWHVTTATHNSRYSQRMFDHHVKRGEAVWLSEKEEIIVTETIAEIAKKDRLNIVAYNICGDHAHIILACKEEELPKIVQKLKAMSARACNIAMGRTIPAQGEHAPRRESLGADTAREPAPALRAPGHYAAPRGKTQCHLWAEKFGAREITGNEQFDNTFAYIKNNRKKHKLPENKALQNIIAEMTCSRQQAFRTEYEGGFDVVIGNPPYGAKLEKADKNFLKENYHIAEYNYDTYNFFFELSLKILKERSYLGFITPNTFLVVENGVLLRKMLFEDNKLIELYETFNVFPDAVVEPITSIIQKTPSKHDDSFDVLLDARDKSKLGKLHFKHHHIFRKASLVFNYRETKKERNLHDKLLDNSKPLSNYADVKAGIKPYEKGKGVPPQTSRTVKEKPFNSYEKNDDSWHKLVRGTQINRYHINWDGEYLKYGAWLAAPRNPNSFFKPKIFIRRTDDKLLCSYDYEKYVGLNSIHCLQKKTENIDYKFLLTILNSKLCNWFFRHENFHMVGKPLAEVKVVFVERLPIILADNQQPFILHADRIISLYKKRHNTITRFHNRIKTNFEIGKVSNKLNAFYDYDFKTFISEVKKQKAKISLNQQDEWEEYFNSYKSEINQLQSQITQTDKEIDRMVYELYGLTEEEIKIVENA